MRPASRPLLLPLCLAAALVVPRGAAADDLADPGLPATKVSHLLALDDGQGPSDHFAYDATTHHVFEQEMHGTLVSVAVHRKAAKEKQAKAIAAYATACFHHAWHVFGGYRYDRFGLRVRGPAEPPTFSLSNAGVTLGAQEVGQPWFHEMVAHETFHCWLGGVVLPAPTAELFPPETWVVEGFTTYYGMRVMGIAGQTAWFHAGMESRLAQHESFAGGALDLDVFALAQAASEDMNGPAAAALYARGALLGYRLDQILQSEGRSLDDLLSWLYVERGLSEQHFTTADLQTGLLARTGDDHDAFFSTMVATNAPLGVSAPLAFHPNAWSGLASCWPRAWRVKVLAPSKGLWILRERIDGAIEGHAAGGEHEVLRVEGSFQHDGDPHGGALEFETLTGGAALPAIALDLATVLAAGANGPKKLRLASSSGLLATATRVSPLAAVDLTMPAAGFAATAAGAAIPLDGDVTVEATAETWELLRVSTTGAAGLLGHVLRDPKSKKSRGDLRLLAPPAPAAATLKIAGAGLKTLQLKGAEQSLRKE